ncbi:MAG: TerC family protein [candidate division KSB1 bacterium]|nr:TerC family protein [candidate division KSB1 bacterium]MDZ7334122.1 TerC family protein [candidate division KSB1 bacterium]MDZ7356289.1 TerC family protein [candidate division KSB1 bacterium]MDZ7401382.1 TerC family protein [candidate division KSB1 bacterium]
MEWLVQPEAWIALITLTALEIVLGIDNIVFISILVSRLPVQKRNKARIIGLSLAMISRILLLLSIQWVMRLTRPWFSLFDHFFSGRDLILIFGGLFLLGKSTLEIHHSLEGLEKDASKQPTATSFGAVLIQIMALDIIFSLDSVITAVGMARHLPVMILAIVIAVMIMMLSARSIGNFVDRHPTVKMLALSFLILIGVTLVAEGLHFHIPKGYIYFAMAFSVFVEMLNLRVRARIQHPVALRKPIK